MEKSFGIAALKLLRAYHYLTIGRSHSACVGIIFPLWYKSFKG